MMMICSLNMYMGGRKRMEHGKRPIISMEFGKIVHILTDFRNKNTGRQGYFYYFEIIETQLEIIPLWDPPP